MWQKLIHLVVIPLLFVAISAVVSVVVVRSVDPVDVSKYEAVTDDYSYATSPYDAMFQRVGGEYNIDWLLLSAIARAESQYKFDAVSKVGAVGLMQIMPAVARRMGYERDHLFDAEVSARVASELLIENNKMLNLRSNFDKTERVRFILACYNAGYSRIADARRLARYYNEDANQWSVVATYLQRLAEPEYAEHEVVQAGAFTGSAETIAYVNRVIHIYKLYQERIFL